MKKTPKKNETVRQQSFEREMIDELWMSFQGKDIDAVDCYCIALRIEDALKSEGIEVETRLGSEDNTTLGVVDSLLGNFSIIVQRPNWRASSNH